MMLVAKSIPLNSHAPKSLFLLPVPKRQRRISHTQIGTLGNDDAWQGVHGHAAAGPSQVRRLAAGRRPAAISCRGRMSGPAAVRGGGRQVKGGRGVAAEPAAAAAGRALPRVVALLRGGGRVELKLRAGVSLRKNERLLVS